MTASRGVVALRRFCLVAGAVACAAVPRPSALRAQRPPTVQALLDAHEKALGGRAALDKHESLRLSGRVEIEAADLRGTIEILRAKPDRYVQKISLNRVGELRKGFDGTVAWVIEPSGPALLTDIDAELMRIQAGWHHEFTVTQALRGARVDSAEFEGVRVWRLTYATSLGVEVHAYFDRETGLRVGEAWTTSAGETTMLQGEYKVFGGVKLPTRIVTRATIGEMVITIETAEFDRVDAAAFVLPPAVKAIAR